VDAKQAWQAPAYGLRIKAHPTLATHSATGWALPNGKYHFGKISPSPEPVNGHEWYVNSGGDDDATHPGKVSFLVGIERDYGVIDKETTQ